jgi:predicted nucleic acid-binding protein
MDIVVDTSVIIAVIANEPEKDRLIQQTTGVDLLAPPSCHWEIGNAFSAMLRRGRITLEQAQDAIQAYQEIPVRFVDVDLGEAVGLAERLGIYAYDAYIIACALNQRCSIISLDRGLVTAARAAGVDVLEIRS